jgi:hypothetical protein
MKKETRIAAIRLAAIITAFLLIIILTMTSLNLSLPTESYSPFQDLAAVQTINMTIIGMISFVALMLVEGRGTRFDPRSVMLMVAVVILSFLIQYTADPRQLQQFSLAFAVFFFLPGNAPLIETPYFTTIYVLPLLFYGGILGLLMSYLISDTPQSFKNRINEALPKAVLQGFSVVFLGPALLTIPVAFTIGAIQSVAQQFFPYYGEGTSGSILVVSVILSMYISARLITNWERLGLKSIINAKFSAVVPFLVELVGSYACITAAFSLLGGLLTDGTPPAAILPLDYILLSILVVIPFSLLVTRGRLFPQAILPSTNQSADYESKG